LRCKRLFRLGEGALRRLFVAPEKSGDMAGDRRIGGVGQSEFDQPGAPLQYRLIDGDARHEAVDDHVQHFVALQLDAASATDQLGAAAEQGQQDRFGCAMRQQLFLGGAAARRQLRKTRRRQFLAATLRQARLDQVGQRQIHIVATEHQVVADTDARQLRLAVLERYLNQGQVSGAATDVTDHQQPRFGELRVQAFLMAEQPVVKRCLRFLEQTQLGQAGLPRGFDGQRPRAFVEGSGNGQDHLLLFERCLREAVPPGGANVRQITGAGGDRRNLGDSGFRTPGQDGAMRSTEACDNQLLALATRRPGTCAPSSSAKRPVRAS
jgi:hypothetical protein